MKHITILTISGGVLQQIDSTDKDHTFVLIDWDNMKSGSASDKPVVFFENFVTMKEAKEIIAKAGGKSLKLPK